MGSLVNYKILVLFLYLFGVALVCLLPFLSKSIRTNSKYAGIGNTFAAGIFLAVAIMELLPHSVEKFVEADIEYEKLVYLLIIAGYTIILTLEKIIFDGHSHIHHQTVPSSCKSTPNSETDNQEGVEALIRNSINPKTSFTLFVARENDNSENPRETPQVDCENNLECPKESGKSNFTPYLLAIALSTHSILEGIAIGLQEKTTGLVNLAVGVALHKVPECLALSISLLSQPKKKVIIILAIFILTSPVGIAIGILIEGEDPSVESVFLSLCTGTFIYIAASEIIAEEFSVKSYKIQKYISYLLGIATFAILAHFFGHDHEDEEGEEAEEEHDH